MKRFLKGLSFAGVAALVLTISACDLTELNENPNDPTTVTTPSLLTNAQNYLATTYWQDYAGGFWVRYAQYWTTNQYTDADRFDFPTARGPSNNNNWNRFYLALNDLQEIVRLNRETPGETQALGAPANQIAIAKIMQAFTWQMMTDMWGPIPFEDALQGRSDATPDSVAFTPSYSSQETIYRSLLDSLTSASEMIVEGEPALASADIVYGGDMSKWKKLANSLKMRVAIRMADVAPEAASQAINEAIAAGVFTSNADNALIPFSGSPPYRNPFYINYEVDGRDDWAIPESFLGVMNDREDPRRTAYFTDAEPAASGNQFNAFPYGLTEASAQALWQSGNFSRPNPRVRGEAGAPAFVMFYDEVLFIKAEAAQRGWISDDPASLYRDAITASLDRWGVDGASDYISRVPYDNSNDWAPEDDEWNSEGDWRHTLGIQKWIALYLQGIQGWAEWRRLDFQEVLQVPPPETTGGETPGQELFNCDFPLRMVYPTDEATLNPASRQAAVDDFLGGTDDQGAALWWDVMTPTCD